MLIAISYGSVSLCQIPVDARATKETRNLLINLHSIAQTGFMFGHQDDQAYGVGWIAEKKRSDVLETAGSLPAVHGWDVGKRLTNESNIDNVRFSNMVGWIKSTYRRRGINTLSWHLDNLTTGRHSWDRTPSVADILPGGSKHEVFLEQLDALAVMLNNCQVWFTKVPVIFRPWHEHNGDWFWWGKGNCTEEEYIRLFRFTVDYLRNEKDIHHLLYAFSPDRSRLRLDTLPEENYLYGYPGDEYVDVIGLDNYGDVGRIGGPDSVAVQQAKFVTSLKLITKIARDKQKVAALTETGLEGITNNRWFTDIILNPIKENNAEIDIAWMLVWRNFDVKHHYAPFRGHPSVDDFIRFEADELTFFENDLDNPYKLNRAIDTE